MRYLRSMNRPYSFVRRALGTWRRLRTDFAEFLQLEMAGSVVMLGATVLALVIANTAAYSWYEEFLHTEILVQIGTWDFSQSILHWIDDGLMALFFFVVGLEIKREIVVGELSKPRTAALPMIAAAGGMIAPALIYLAVNAGGRGADGWGIPMATDIAFAMGVLALLGSRAPSGLRLFLVALAIADDLGAIVVIALFYTKGVAVGWLALAAIALMVLIVMNRMRVDSPVPYLLVGLVVWFAVLNSGVHATIAGVLVALTIPTASRLQPMEFCALAREKLDEIEREDIPGAHVLQDDSQQEAAYEIRSLATHSAAPLQRIEHALHPFTTFFVLPLFAFANAGIRLVDYDLANLILEPVTIGVMLGLLLGKPLGIASMTWLAVRLGVTDLPHGVEWKHILGAGMLGGIGFTMSIFIANLAFRNEVFLTEAKLAVLVTSAMAGTVAYVYLRAIARDGRPA